MTIGTKISDTNKAETGARNMSTTVSASKVVVTILYTSLIVCFISHAKLHVESTIFNV